MKYRKLDASDDYTFGTGGDFYQNQPEAVAQAILTRLRLWYGEWFLDVADGMPWNEEVLGKRFKTRNPDGAIKTRILGTEGVQEIVSYSSTFDGNTRSLSVQCTVNTIYGQITINEVLR